MRLLGGRCYLHGTGDPGVNGFRTADDDIETKLLPNAKMATALLRLIVITQRAYVFAFLDISLH